MLSFLYSTLEMEANYQIEALDPLHHWAPKLNEALSEYQSQHSQNQEPSLFFSWVKQHKAELPCVRYLTQTELENLKVTFQLNNAITYVHTKQKIGMTDTEKGPAPNTQVIMFALSAQGDFYVHKKVKPNKGELGFNHSSFFSGKPVAGVGFFHFNQNMDLIAIDDYSGHYKPTKMQMLNVFHALTEKGVDLSKISYNRRISPLSFDKEILNAQAWYMANKYELEASRTKGMSTASC